MSKLLSFRKLSVKITFIVAATVVIVAGAASFYMQTRIIEEIDDYSRLYVRYRLIEVAEKCDVAIVGNSEIGQIEDIIKRETLYNTGSFAMVDDRGAFFESNSFISNLSASEKAQISALAGAIQNHASDIRLGGEDYLVSHITLHNSYSLFAFAPKNEAMAEVNASITRFIVIFAIVLLLVIIISSFIGRSISKPISIVASTVDKLAAGTFETGELNSIMEKPDETGILARAVNKLSLRLSHLTDEMKVIADGDLSGEIKLEFEGDEIGGSLNKTLETLTDMFSKINQSADAVSFGVRQVSSSAQALAQGTNEQSKSIDELSTTFALISQKTKDNTGLADEAAALTETIKNKAETGSRHMDQMITVVNEINKASQNISNVIKIIDDIAFQTNILALNAAVEAARAGQHGKGFAVVADEVRSLASKSAEAAKNTEALISESVEKAELGVRIANETVENFTEIVSGISESGKIVSDIALSSKSQTDEIVIVNTAVEHVASIIHQNSAIAQESAASSEEMNGQADMLVELVSQFKIRKDDTRYRSIPPANR